MNNVKTMFPFVAPFIGEGGVIIEMGLKSLDKVVQIPRKVENKVKLADGGDNFTIVQENFNRETITFPARYCSVQVDVYISEKFLIDVTDDDKRQKMVQVFMNQISPWLWSFAKRVPK